MDACRPVTRTVDGRAVQEGAGVRVNRLIGGPALAAIDPFLLLDEIRSDDPSDYIAGFPEHPHRGFETVTYLLAGRVRHRDNAGHSGVIGAGGVQWMTAGRGVIHSEMPEQEDGVLDGFQLWVNLPARHKLIEPRYQEFDAGEVPVEERGDGVEVRVLAGTTGRGTEGPVRELLTPALYLDVTLPEGAGFTEPLPPGFSAFIYPFRGSVRVHETAVWEQTLAVLGEGECITMRGRRHSRVLVVAGQPLDEPVARRGPFVMNTEEELQQAFRDYQSGRLSP